MKISKKIDNGNAILHLGGRIDSTSAPKFEKETVEVIETNIQSLTFECSKLDYISSAGLRVLLLAQKRMKGKGNVTVKNPNNVVLEIFDVTGFINILTVE